MLPQKRPSYRASDGLHSNFSELKSIHVAFQVVDLLLEAGADIHHTDEAGMCAMDRAISNQQTAVVSRLLVYGAAIQQKSWALAQGKQEILSVLLSKLKKVRPTNR